MSTDWQSLGPHEKIEWLHTALSSLEKTVLSTQDDVSGLANRVIELGSQQTSTFELATEVVATVERIESRK